MHASMLNATFREQGYLPVQGFLEAPALGVLQSYAAIQFANGRFVRDATFSRSLCLYGDPGFDAVLDSFTARVGEIAGEPLAPTYSYARIYGEGDVLERHTDRAACEVSVTVALKVPRALSASVLRMKSRNAGEVAVSMQEGDGCVYSGIDVEHWRDPLPVGGLTQLFLHYIRKAGPHYPRHRFDQRRQLGLPCVHGSEAS